MGIIGVTAVAQREQDGRLPVIGAGFTQWPTPESQSVRHGNFSPGSCLRDGATSECASTRTGGILCRVWMPRHSAVTAAIWRFGKIG